MPRLIPLKPKEVEKILRKHGFEHIHTVGSHRQFFNSQTKAHTTVPFGHRDLAKGTLKAIINQSGLSEKLFRR